MINANEIRNQQEKEFKETFDFAAFDKYLENYFVNEKKNNLYIGLCSRHQLTKWYPEFLSKCDDLGFNPNGHHYIWRSKIQISHEVQPYVEKYLHENGFSTFCKGACGYDKYDVLVVCL